MPVLRWQQQVKGETEHGDASNVALSPCHCQHPHGSSPPDWLGTAIPRQAKPADQCALGRLDAPFAWDEARATAGKRRVVGPGLWSSPTLVEMERASWHLSLSLHAILSGWLTARPKGSQVANGWRPQVLPFMDPCCLQPSSLSVERSMLVCVNPTQFIGDCSRESVIWGISQGLQRWE